VLLGKKCGDRCRHRRVWSSRRLVPHP
jgi:hypothetical protein